VTRDVGGSVNSFTTGSPDSRRNRTVAGVEAFDAFASRTYVSNMPCDPSAKYQVDWGPSTAVPVWPPYPAASHVIVRSTTRGRPAVEVTTVETAVAARPGRSFTRMVILRCAPSNCDIDDVVPSSLRNWISIGASTPLGLAIATSSENMLLVAPSAR
jgi:hypothetical protein